jgi:hypothetical protein
VGQEGKACPLHNAVGQVEVAPPVAQEEVLEGLLHNVVGADTPPQTPVEVPAGEREQHRAVALPDARGRAVADPGVLGAEAAEQLGH